MKEGSENDLFLEKKSNIIFDENIVESEDVHKNVFNSKLSMISCLTLFSTSYCAQPLLLDMMKYHGAITDKSTFTFYYLLPHYLAMILIGLLPNEGRSLWCEQWKKPSIIALIDMAHQLMEKGGLILCGSGLYIVIGSSSIIWTALLASYWLRQRFSAFQWTSLILIFFGLVVRSTSVVMSFQSREFLGVLLVLISSILHAVTFVVNEKLLSDISGPSLVGIMGFVNTLALLAWTLIYTFPKADDLILSCIRERGGSFKFVLACLFCLFCTGLIHSYCLWMIIKVTAGVIKGFKTVVVAIASHVMFCYMDEVQCLTWSKGISAIVCGLGVCLYGLRSTTFISNCTDTDNKNELSHPQRCSSVENVSVTSHFYETDGMELCIKPQIDQS
eukprot:GHVL01019603.1.p1 GENE.GHVL01019603.1~~GHVL01019603.1.p1  ORF type:complete len:388 (+),score=41.22 GHVL01019603.1:64-1227(+)